MPVFDRDLELVARRRADRPARPAGRSWSRATTCCCDDPPWDALAPLFDRTLFVDVPEAELAAAPASRAGCDHGLDPAAARARADGNDLPNARLVAARSRPADVLWTG